MGTASSEACDRTYDVIVVGAGVSGGFLADALTEAGLRVAVLEAGRAYASNGYPKGELQANAELYWGGGIELTADARIGLLRARAVGGGSIVNQALLDRFDDDAFDSWQDASGCEFLARASLDPYYDRVAERVHIERVPEEFRNGNADVFRDGFEANGYRSAPLERAQRDCRFGDGNSCIVCLHGCPIESKQSTSVTVLRRAAAAGCTIVPQFLVERVSEDRDGVEVSGQTPDGRRSVRGGALVLAAGSLGNSRFLLQSDFGARLPALGHNFYTHPQFMNLGVYDEPVDSFRGPMQSYKSADPGFRKRGFKLENVFTPPVSLAMLVPGFGPGHLDGMRKMRHFACIEVAVRDTEPGRIRLGPGGSTVVQKSMNDEDRARRERGLDAIRNIFYSTGAKEIVEGEFAVGLHLMGGCNLGVDPARSVVGPDFALHGSRRIFAADSSTFPNAPGINPSYTIMALSLMAAERIVEEVGR